MYVGDTEPVMATDPPAHIDGAEGVTLIPGTTYALMTFVAVAVHPAAVAAVTVYVVVLMAVGAQFTDAPVVADKYVAGAHV